MKLGFITGRNDKNDKRGKNMKMKRSSSAYTKYETIVFLLLATLLVSCEKKTDYNLTENGVRMNIGGKYLAVSVYDDDIFRVTYTADSSLEHKSLMTVLKEPLPVKWDFADSAGNLVISTSKLKVRIDKRTGRIGYFDREGHEILREKEQGRTLDPAEVMGENTYHVMQKFDSPENEALYGLGQHQNHLMNYKGYDVDLWQDNMVAVVPFLVSNRGYGILWDNNSRTKFGSPEEPRDVPSGYFSTEKGAPGSLTVKYFINDKRVAEREEVRVHFSAPDTTSLPFQLSPGDRLRIEWSGEITVPENRYV